ncbi:EF-hand domain-containing protein [Longispora albida]|uniref:EF-hand domain-containing protein n=1 Tax=Longispora albida TaxID=203523 RepID=UPI000370D06E|nr:EF-hand domain-containing protein [Longispora albida]
MSTDFQRQKYTRRFRLLDLDGDGYVQESDFGSLGRRMIAASGSAEDPARAAEISEVYRDGWHRLCAATGTSTDDRVARDDFVAACVASLDSGSGFDWVILPTVNAVLTGFDLDRDGILSADEFSAWLRGNGIGPGAITETLRRVDRDGDGKITAEDLMTMAEEFYRSNDPDAPGNWILGVP